MMADPNSWRFRSPADPIYPTSFRPPPFPQLHPPPPPPPPSSWERPSHPPPPPFLPPPPPPYPNPPTFGFGGGAVDSGRPLKRPRCEDPEAVAAEDERRLNLVRFHGGHAPGDQELYHAHVRAGPYDHRPPLLDRRPYPPMARPDWLPSNRPSELPHHPWRGDRYDGNQFGVRSQLPPRPSYPYPPCPPLPPPSQPGPSPASVINSSISPFKDPVGVAGHHYSSVVQLNGHKSLTMKPLAQEKPKKIDASYLFKHPHRATRPDHLVVILRGLPGSGKSYLAKLLRDVEVENGGKAPRIHSMDDYFMTEVEKAEEIEGTKSSSQSVKGKKKITKRVMEYCYEPEMEEAYRASMLKAFKKTLEEGIFTFIIVDDRNLQVADFAQFWAAAKTSGYEVYLLEAAYKDPVGCAARNVHGFTLKEIQKMVHQWEQAPSLYLQLDVQSLTHADDLLEQGINEVDMDTEDPPLGEGGPSEFENMKDRKISLPSFSNDAGKNVEEEGGLQEVKELGKSKWSEDLEDVNQEKIDALGKPYSLPALMQAYTEGVRSVHWSDQVGTRGFSISASKQSNVSLIIGPGAGYNLTSNPLPEEEKIDTSPRVGSYEQRKTAFVEHLRAERESFRAVFARRRQRIGGLEVDD